MTDNNTMLKMNHKWTALFTTFLISSSVSASSILELSIVADAKAKCEKNHKDLAEKPEQYYKTIEGCTWKELGESGQEEVLAIMEADKKTKSEAKKRAPSSEAGNKSSDKTTDEYSAKKPGYILALHDHLKKKLEEALYGNEKQKIFTKHAEYYRLYESILGKNLITTITSYCIEVDLDNDEPKETVEDYFLANDTGQTREDNIVLLREKPERAFELWNSCISNISNVCQYEGNAVDIDEMRLQKSRQRACGVSHYMRKSRDMLMSVTTIRKSFDKPSKISFKIDDDYKYYDSNDKDTGVDSLTTISSNEINQALEDSKYDSSEDEYNKCFDAKDKAINLDECKGFLSEKKDVGDKMLATSLEYRAMNRKFDEQGKKLKDEDLQKYLAEKGYGSEDSIDKNSKKSINELLSNKKITTGELKDELAKQYEAERKQLIAGLNDKLAKESVNKIGDDGESKEIKNGLESIKDRIKNGQKNSIQLTHFTNIVSGYLKLCSPGTSEKDCNKEGKRNTGALKKELSNSAYSKDGRQPSDASKSVILGGNSEFEKLQGSTEDARKAEEASEDENTMLGVQKINEHLIKIVDPFE